MGWFYLFLAGALEIVFTTSLKLADGFTKFAPSAVFVIAYASSAWFLARSIQTIPLGTAYAVWTGVGAIGTAAVGIIAFGESMAGLRLLFLCVIVVGIIGLKFVTD